MRGEANHGNRYSCGRFSGRENMDVFADLESSACAAGKKELSGLAAGELLRRDLGLESDTGSGTWSC